MGAFNGISLSSNYPDFPRTAPPLLDTSGSRLALFACARNARAAPEMKVEEAPALSTQPARHGQWNSALFNASPCRLGYFLQGICVLHRVKFCTNMELVKVMIVCPKRIAPKVNACFENGACTRVKGDNVTVVSSSISSSECEILSVCVSSPGFRRPGTHM